MIPPAAVIHWTSPGPITPPSPVESLCTTGGRLPDAANLGAFGYTGQVWLPELGMNYYKARMYSPTLGRFMQTDPIGYGDGMNMYAYVHGDPVNGVDPSGLRLCTYSEFMRSVRESNGLPPGPYILVCGSDDPGTKSYDCSWAIEACDNFLNPRPRTGDGDGDGGSSTPSKPQNVEPESDFDFWDCAGSVALGGAVGAINPVGTVRNAGQEIANGMNRTRPADARFLSPEEKMSPNGQGRLKRSFGAAARIAGRQLIASNPWVRAGGALIGGGGALLTNPSCGIGIGTQIPNAPIL